MQDLFKKYFWMLRWAAFAAALGLAASAVATELGTRYLFAPDEAAETADPADAVDEDDETLEFGDSPFGQPKRTAPTGPSRTKLAAQLAAKNPFCPTCAPLPTPGEGPVATDEAGRPLGPVVSAGEVKSSLPLVLMATMESTSPEHSFATIYDPDAEMARLYSNGDIVRPGVLLLGIERGLVHLRNGAALEYLLLRDGEIPQKSAVAPAAVEEEKPPGAIDGAETAIKCPTENTCVVERAFVEGLLANPAQLATQARVIPAMKDGETKGFKFYGIRKGSLPSLLGLKNGDMILSINGEELVSVDQAMGLYMKLRNASNLSLTLDRKGETVSKEIQIQ
jgi:general secretion pathway protein C